VNSILDADIKGFFDAVNQDWLIRFLEHRIGDERIIRLVRKWLKAGVLEMGQWQSSDMALMATSNSPTFGQSNSPRQDG